MLAGCEPRQAIGSALSASGTVGLSRPERRGRSEGMATVNEARHWTIGDWVQVEGVSGAYSIQGWAHSSGRNTGPKRTSRRTALASTEPRVVLWTGRYADSFAVAQCRRVAPPPLHPVSDVTLLKCRIPGACWKCNGPIDAGTLRLCPHCGADQVPF